MVHLKTALKAECYEADRTEQRTFLIDCWFRRIRPP
jgi:hypothetical protein